MHWAAAGNRLFYLLRPVNAPAQLVALVGGVNKHTLLALDPRTDALPDTVLRVDLPPDNEVVMGATYKMKFDMRVPQLQLSGDGANRVLLATTDTFRIRVLDADGKTTGWLTRDNVTRHRYTSAEQELRKHQIDSLTQASSKQIAAYTGGLNVPRPEIEYIMPEYAPALGSMIAGDRFVLVMRVAEQGSQPREWDILDYNNRLLGIVMLPVTFGPRVLSGDRLFGVERDELDVESVTIYRIVPPRG